MKSYSIFKEYIWLVNTIRKAGKISLAEINRRWCETELSGGVEFARTTFNRHKEAIQDIFGLVLLCDNRDGYKYYFENGEVLRGESVQNWMLSTFSVNTLLSESMSLKDRILLECIPSDGKYLHMIIDAMRKGVRIAVSYQRYGESSPRRLTMDPYCIKLFEKRWYLVGHFHRDASAVRPEADYTLVFSLDRIKDMELTETKFVVSEDFDARQYFENCYGVIVGEERVERVTIRAYGAECHYMRDLPLHASQREIASTPTTVDFEMQISPTIDFCNRIMQAGDRLRVLQPLWLAEKVKQMHLDAIKRYEEK